MNLNFKSPCLYCPLSESTGAAEMRPFKGTLMQIWKFRHMFAFKQKQYNENFEFLILEIFELFALEVCKFLKK